MFRGCPTSSKCLKKKKKYIVAKLTWHSMTQFELFRPTRQSCVLALLAASSPLPLPLVAISSHPDVHNSRWWLSQKYDNKLPGKLIVFSRKKKKNIIKSFRYHFTSTYSPLSFQQQWRYRSGLPWKKVITVNGLQAAFTVHPPPPCSLNYQAYNLENVNVTDCNIN